jgi:hypothetical protein
MHAIAVESRQRITSDDIEGRTVRSFEVIDDRGEGVVEVLSPPLITRDLAELSPEGREGVKRRAILGLTQFRCTLGLF